MPCDPTFSVTISGLSTGSFVRDSSDHGMQVILRQRCVAGGTCSGMWAAHLPVPPIAKELRAQAPPPLLLTREPSAHSSAASTNHPQLPAMGPLPFNPSLTPAGPTMPVSASSPQTLLSCTGAFLACGRLKRVVRHFAVSKSGRR
jgi:hypothetical protein